MRHSQRAARALITGAVEEGPQVSRLERMKESEGWDPEKGNGMRGGRWDEILSVDLNKRRRCQGFARSSCKRETDEDPSDVLFCPGVPFFNDLCDRIEEEKRMEDVGVFR